MRALSGDAVTIAASGLIANAGAGSFVDDQRLSLPPLPVTESIN
jgi:hypothetical protein